MTIRGRIFRLSPQFFGTEVTINEFLDDHVAVKKMVILGEYHGAIPIVELQTSIQEKMASSLRIQYATPSKIGMNTAQCENVLEGMPKVRLILEHFSMDMQGILNQFHNGMLDTQGLLHAYRQIGTEGHNLQPYIPALESAIRNDNIRIYGGFLPRSYARILMREGPKKAIEQASEAGFISKDETLDGTDAHYNYFESLLTGRNMHLDPLGEMATDRFRAKMFPAQIIKDASMAWCAKTLDRIFNITGQDRMLLVCGVGHMLYWNGVPERILANAKETAVVKSKDDILRVACLPVSQGTLENLTTDAENDDSRTRMIMSTLKEEYGSSDAADFCFVYEEEPEETSVDEEQIQEETKAAYDKVGNTAHLEGGDMKKAHGILTSLFYTQEEIDYAGTDAVNYQGVGCPHRHADIKEGDFVLDLGSGLGVDSLIATRAVGSSGRVVGIDLSNECVQHASKRAKERGVDSILSFMQSPIESIGRKIDSNETKFDQIISNGAFCLLPNKKKGFAECYRLLKNGGKIVVCTTVIKNKLEDGVEWPLCMQTFAKMEDLEPMLRELGFEDVEIDLSDSLMETYEELDDQEDERDVKMVDNTDDVTTEESIEGRFKVHNEEGQKQYRHLENFDMNMLCARVVIKARKPAV